MKTLLLAYTTYRTTLPALIKNMKKIQLSVIAFFALSAVSFAQDRLLTIDDIFSTDPNVRVRFAGTPASVKWSPDGRSFKQVVGGKLMRVDAVSGNAEPYFDNASLAAALVRAGVKTDEANKLANSPGLQFDPSETSILINHDKDLWF